MSLSTLTVDGAQAHPMLSVSVNAPMVVPNQMPNVTAKASVGVTANKRTCTAVAAADTKKRKTAARISQKACNLVRPITTRRPLLVGSDCSGWCSEKFALAKLGIHDYIHMFACDINKWSKKFNVQNVPSHRWYVDCLSDARMNAPYVDLYIAGFPSEQVAAGRPLIVEDFRCILDYITRRQPAVFILENVKIVLDMTNRDAWLSILTRLAKIRTPTGQITYSVCATILNSKHYGVPQDRERVYVVGRRLDMIIGDKSTFKLGTADTMAMPPILRKFLGIEHEVGSINVVDMGSVTGLNTTHNICPSITPARAQTRSYFLTSVGRRLTAFELCRLQGVDPQTPNWNGIPDSAIGVMAGNAMTVPDLAHVIREALLSTGLAQPGGNAPIVFP